MKKVMKVILPILMAAAVIFSIGWYLFEYDRDFTRDMLLQQARYWEANGNHKISAWFYNVAYEHASEGSSVAIELAEQYRSSGNYTKAEVTLSDAIADGPSAELYTALCKVYVEQDKLLDAVNMLGSISDPEIKAKIDKLRPKAPIADPAHGFYSQYITVNISAPGATLFVSTEGQWPSIMDPPFSGSYTLPQGETTIWAIAVNDSGLVSPLAIFGYTVGGVIEEVDFADPAVELALRQMLMIPEGTPVYTNELWNITEFTMPADAEVYADLAYLTYLQKLTIDDGAVGQLMSLSSLARLTELNLTNCPVSQEELAIIGNLPSLQKLKLSGCGLSSIEPLAPAVKLTHLDLSNNTLRNLEVISGMTGIQEVNLQHNAVTGLSAFKNLTSLLKLDISYNSVTNLSDLSTCPSLTWLDASQNLLPSLGAIHQLTNLTHLNLSHNKLTSVDHLASCTTLRELDISNNALTDITALSPLVNLTVFNFSYNEITALPQWSSSCQLVNINGSYNLVESIDVLGGMEKLNYVYMDYNKITNIDALAACPRLVRVDVYGNEIEDVTSVTKNEYGDSTGIIVNYTPMT